MTQLRSSSFLIIYVLSYVSPIHSFLIGKKEADMVLPLRSNSGIFEELQKTDYNRECVEENCSQEELREWSGNDNLNEKYIYLERDIASIIEKLTIKSARIQNLVKKDFVEAIFNPCNSEYPELLKNKFICHKKGVQQCFSTKQNEIDFCRCKPNYKQCEDGGNECSVRCKHLKEDCPTGFKWNRMGTDCECAIPYFINRLNNGTITSQKLFSDKHCKSDAKRKRKICDSFCGKKKNKNCSIKTHLSNNLYTNSTNEDVTCKCRPKYFEVNPKTGRCRKNKIKINKSCRQKCNTDFKNGCELTTNSVTNYYFVECTKQTPRVANTTVSRPSNFSTIVNTTITAISSNFSCWTEVNHLPKCEWFLSNYLNKINPKGTVWFTPDKSIDKECNESAEQRLFTTTFCEEHSCDSGKCCFKNQISQDEENRYIFDQSDILCK